MTIAIVSAATANFYPMIEQWLASLQACNLSSDARIGLLDLGLTDIQRASLAAQQVMVARPGWDIPFRGAADAPPWFKAMVSRPFLPTHFPGFETYLWIDADAWVHDPAIIAEIAAAAGSGAVAVSYDRFDEGVLYIASETGPLARESEANVRQIVADTYHACFGPETRERAFDRIINVGVLGLRGDSPAWSVWQEYLGRGLAAQGWRQRMVEQQALNLAILEGRVAVEWLPRRANLNLATGLPHVDRAGRRLVAPDDPSATVGILHLTTLKALTHLSLPCLGGGEIETPLRFTEARAWFDAGCPPTKMSG